jgi:hypothetical protein
MTDKREGKSFKECDNCANNKGRLPSPNCDRVICPKDTIGHPHHKWHCEHWQPIPPAGEKKCPCTECKLSNKFSFAGVVKFCDNCEKNNYNKFEAEKEEKKVVEVVDVENRMVDVFEKKEPTEENKEKSDCCNAPVTIEGDDDEGTYYYKCTKCNNACDRKKKSSLEMFC